MSKRTVRGTIMSHESGMPTFSNVEFTDKNTNEKKTMEICRFKVVEKNSKSEPIQVELVNSPVSQWLTAGRRVEVSGEAQERPHFDNKNGKFWINPSIKNAEITLLDLPITKSAADILALVEEKELLSEEAYLEFKASLEAVAQEVFDAGRRYKSSTPERIETLPADPEDNPL